MSQQFQIVGLGNALMDVLVRLEDDSILSAQSLDKGIMHPVDDQRWKEVYSAVEALPVERSLQTGSITSIDAWFDGGKGLLLWAGR